MSDWDVVEDALNRGAYSPEAAGWQAFFDANTRDTALAALTCLREREAQLVKDVEFQRRLAVVAEMDCTTAEARVQELEEARSRLENRCAAWEAKKFAAEARVKELEEEVAHWKWDCGAAGKEVRARNQQLEARVQELEELLGEDAGAAWFNQKVRVAQLEEALREIDNYGTHYTPQTAIARRALAHEEEIQGDGSGHALPPLIEGYSAPRWDRVAHEEEK